MKNFLRKYLGLTDMESRLIDLSDEISGLESSLKGELMDDLSYDMERHIEQQVDSEVDDRLYNYDFEEMKDKIDNLEDESSGFDNRIVGCQERLEALADKIDTLGIFDRLSALEEKLND